MLEESLINMRDTPIDCSHFFQKQVFSKNVFHGTFELPNLCVLFSLATAPNTSVAALLAASPVSTAVPSDAVSPEVLSLPQPKTLTPLPKNWGSRLDKAFDDLVEKRLPIKYVESHVWEDPRREVDRGAGCQEQNFTAASARAS